MGKHCNRKMSEISGQSSDYTRTTIDAIKEVFSTVDDSSCSDRGGRPRKINCCESEPECTSMNSCGCQGSRPPATSRYDPGVAYFQSVITPVTNLHSSFSDINGLVEFRMRRKNKTVTLQWEPFSGAVSQSGISNLVVSQSIYNTPPYPLFFPILLSYKGVNRFGLINIDPYGCPANIRFYLNSDASSTGINSGDAFSVYGSSVTWIVE